jgi:hypothetical protein
MIGKRIHLKLSRSIRPGFGTAVTRPAHRRSLTRQNRYKSLLEAEALVLTLIPVVVNKDVASSHAAFRNSSGAFRSGFSQTSSLNFQSRVALDQRSGRRCFAVS